MKYYKANTSKYLDYQFVLYYKGRVDLIKEFYYRIYGYMYTVNLLQQIAYGHNQFMWILIGLKLKHIEGKLNMGNRDGLPLHYDSYNPEEAVVSSI